MFRALSRNPALRWQISRNRWPGLRASLVLAATLAAGISGLMIHHYNQQPTAVPLLTRLMAMSAVVFVLASILTAGVRGALIAGYASTSEVTGLLRLTGISERQYIDNTLAATLYRMRLLLIGVVALTPAFWIGWVHAIAALDNARSCARLLARCDMLLAFSPFQVGGLLAMAGVFALVLLSISLMTASAGILGGVWLRHAGIAAALSIVVTTAFLLPYSLILALCLRIMADAILRAASPLLLLTLLGFTGLLGLSPSILAEEMLQAACRWVWLEDHRGFRPPWW